MNTTRATWAGLTLGAGFLGLSACGGTAIIDPPSGSGGGSASSTAVASSVTTSTSTQSTGSAGRTCNDINEAYEKAFEEAQSCDLDASSNPCTSQQDPTLECPCASFFINPQHPSFSALEELRSAYLAQGCNEDIDCPDITCSQPQSGICVPSPGGGGVCQNN